MRLRPRHYLLLAVLLALTIYNVFRVVRTHHAKVTTAPETPLWQAFDQAAALRDAPEAQFAPALKDLNTQADGATGPDAADLRNCLMWLQYYRHSVPMAAGNAGNWGMLAASHVQSCMAEHRDLAR